MLVPGAYERVKCARGTGNEQEWAAAAKGFLNRITSGSLMGPGACGQQLWVGR